MDSMVPTSKVDLSVPSQGTQQSRTDARDQAVDVAKKFEALLLFTMMKSMRASLSEDPLAGSEQQDMYREMMDREIVESIAEGGGLGLQKMFEQQLSSAPTTTSTSPRNPLIDEIPNPADSRVPTADRTAISLDFLTRQRLLAPFPSD